MMMRVQGCCRRQGGVSCATACSSGRIDHHSHSTTTRGGIKKACIAAADVVVDIGVGSTLSRAANIIATRIIGMRRMARY